MELDAVSVPPSVGHVVVPGSRISGFAYKWVWLVGEWVWLVVEWWWQRHECHFWLLMAT